MNFKKITESDSFTPKLGFIIHCRFAHGINKEDQKVATAVQLIIPEIEKIC